MLVTPEQFGAIGDGVTDDTAAVQTALNSGRSVLFTADYAVTATVLAQNGVTLTGNGRLLKLPNNNGILLRITGSDNRVEGLRFDGSAPQPSVGSLNDIIRIEPANSGAARRNQISGVQISGSKGGGVAIYNSPDNEVINCTIMNVYDNSIFVGGPGADRNRLCFNYLDGTVGQNNIFITASPGSLATPDFVYDNVAIGNICRNAGDTGIESGYHAFGTQVIGGSIGGSTNPGLLLRDGRNVLFKGVTVYPKTLSEQQPEHDGVAVVPQYEAASWRYDSVFENISVIGAVTRSAFYWGGSCLQRINCNAIGYVDNPPASVDALGGSADLMAGAVSDITIDGGINDGFNVGSNWNYDGTAYVRRNCHVRGMSIRRCRTALSMFNITPEFSSFVGNNGFDFTDQEALLTNAVLRPSGTNADVSFAYYGNRFDLSSFAGSTPLRANPIDGLQDALVEPNSQYFRVPVVQYGSTVLLSSAVSGIYTVAFAEAAFDAVFWVSAAQNISIRLAGSPELTDSSGVTGWKVYIENGALICKLMEPDQPEGPRWMRVSGPSIR